MATQDSYKFSTPKTRPLNGRTKPEKGMGLTPALLGMVCVIAVFGILALLFHAG
jgi:hypothetical protein